jgi:adenylate kinase
VEHAIYLDVSVDALVQRLSARLVCPQGHVYGAGAHPPRSPGVCDVDGLELQRRGDDDPETVRRRLDQQLPPLYEVVDHYRERGVLSVIDATRRIGEVGEDILRLLRVGDRAA